MNNSVNLLWVVAASLVISASCGFVGIYLLTSFGWSLVYLSLFTLSVISVAVYLARN